VSTNGSYGPDSQETHQALRELADSEKTSLQTVLERAIEAYRRKRFLDDANRQFQVFRSNEDAWRRELEERNEWDITMNDEPSGD
jgi:hypothetical protein